MTELEKMLAGNNFNGADESVNCLRDSAAKLLQDINRHTDNDQRHEMLQQLLANIPTSSIIRSPFFCEFGKTISIGEHSFINMNVTMLDGAPITISNHVLIGPNCQFYCASHEFNYLQRRQWQTSWAPITIEDDVWIGGSTVINQGVTIGARSVIAANSVVNKDVPPDCLYGGSPARFIRKLHENELLENIIHG
ncbi:acetyltransferase [Shewanella sp. NFH-SH190041]|uniref:sugar O-acetyltransferase n=1 Tax=Shewanella sp. NFH-SH190041 TaxID=2950245 RepID=UPI0021C495EB|nr:sugar O-acetyltransferase [Shewanella sp. NFH-SH190041]BDM64326.1 acetyltransferase [Shewanella sp. NFH-SH190041]